MKIHKTQLREMIRKTIREQTEDPGVLIDQVEDRLDDFSIALKDTIIEHERAIGYNERALSELGDLLEMFIFDPSSSGTLNAMRDFLEYGSDFFTSNGMQDLEEMLVELIAALER